MNITHEAKRLRDVMRNYSDTTKAKTLLGWQPQMDIGEWIWRNHRLVFGEKNHQNGGLCDEELYDRI